MHQNARNEAPPDGRFEKRCNGAQTKETSPIFLQFLDAVYQLTQQFPCCFEFNEKLLLLLADAPYSHQYYDFLGDSEKTRRVRCLYPGCILLVPSTIPCGPCHALRHLRGAGYRHVCLPLLRGAGYRHVCLELRPQPASGLVCTTDPCPAPLPSFPSLYSGPLLLGLMRAPVPRSVGCWALGRHQCGITSPPTAPCFKVCYLIKTSPIPAMWP